MAKSMDFLADQNIGSLEELDVLLAATKEDVSDKHKALKSTESEIKSNNLLIKYTGQYLANKDMYRRYMKSKNKAVFRESHRTEITLYEAARKYLKDAGYLQKAKPKSVSIQTGHPTTSKASSGSSSDSGSLYIPSIRQLKEHKAELLCQKNSQYEDYSHSRAKYRELQTVNQNVHTMLELDAAMSGRNMVHARSAKHQPSL